MNPRWPASNARGSGPLIVLIGLVILLCASPGAATAQVFIATHPKPEFTIGPLFVRANVGPAAGPVDVTVLFSVVVPATLSGGAVAQDLYLLWPGEVDGEAVPGAPEPELRRTVEARGFQVTREGRLPLSARAVYSGPQRPRPETLPGGAPFVTYSREGGPLGQGAPASWIRIPWTPRLVDRTWLVELRMRLTTLRRPKQATWLENVLWGERHVITLSFNDVRTRATFPMYLAHRDRVVHLADDPSQLIINFADSDHLKIHEVYPGSSQRRSSETRRATEIVSAYLDPSEGIRPQVLSVQFRGAAGHDPRQGCRRADPGTHSLRAAQWCSRPARYRDSRPARDARAHLAGRDDVRRDSQPLRAQPGRARASQRARPPYPRLPRAACRALPATAARLARDRAPLGRRAP